jgi:hypothetical protein
MRSWSEKRNAEWLNPLRVADRDTLCERGGYRFETVLLPWFATQI